MKIEFGHPRLKRYRPFSSDETKYLQILIADEGFNKTLKGIRTELGLPEEGLSLENNNFIKYLPNETKNLLRFNSATKLFLLTYSLPITWGTTFSSILLFNIASPPSEPLDFEIEESITDLPVVTIKVREKLSLNALTKVIERSKNKINDLLDRLQKSPKIKVSDLPTKLKILKLKQKGYKDSEIAKELGEVNYDYDSIRTIRIRFLDLYNKLLKHKLPEVFEKKLMK